MGADRVSSKRSVFISISSSLSFSAVVVVDTETLFSVDDGEIDDAVGGGAVVEDAPRLAVVAVVVVVDVVVVVVDDVVSR